MPKAKNQFKEQEIEFGKTAIYSPELGLYLLFEHNKR